MRYAVTDPERALGRVPLVTWIQDPVPNLQNVAAGRSIGRLFG